MKKSFKIAAIATPIAALAAGGIIYAMPNAKPSQNLNTPQPSAVVTEAAANTQPVSTETIETTPVTPAPTPPPAPVETVDSVLASESWSNENDRECVKIIRENKPELFTTVEGTKKLLATLKGTYVTPCAVVQFQSRTILPSYWRAIENKL